MIHYFIKKPMQQYGETTKIHVNFMHRPRWQRLRIWAVNKILAGYFSIIVNKEIKAPDPKYAAGAEPSKGGWGDAEEIK